MPRAAGPGHHRIGRGYVGKRLADGGHSGHHVCVSGLGPLSGLAGFHGDHDSGHDVETGSARSAPDGFQQYRSDDGGRLVSRGCGHVRFRRHISPVAEARRSAGILSLGPDQDFSTDGPGECRTEQYAHGGDDDPGGALFIARHRFGRFQDIHGAQFRGDPGREHDPDRLVGKPDHRRSGLERFGTRGTEGNGSPGDFRSHLDRHAGNSGRLGLYDFAGNPSFTGPDTSG